MALRQFNPVTASLRGTVLINRSELWKGKPVKALTEGKIGTGGRNNHGRITSRFIGGGHKQSIARRFKRRKFDACDGGAAGIRSEPQRVHRAGEVPGRRTALHPRSQRLRPGDAWWPASAPTSSRQRDAARGDPGRHVIHKSK